MLRPGSAMMIHMNGLGYAPQNLARVVVWEWLNEHGRWRPYSAAVCHHIENVLKGDSRGTVVLGQVDPQLAPYIIDLQSMHQFRQDTGTMRPAQRNFYEPSSAPGKGVVWEWENDSGSWTPYDMEICVTIQNAYEKQHPWLDLTSLGFCYLIDFNSMTQTNRQSQRKRRLRRRMDLAYPLTTGVSSGSAKPEQVQSPGTGTTYPRVPALPAPTHVPGQNNLNRPGPQRSALVSTRGSIPLGKNESQYNICWSQYAVCSTTFKSPVSFPIYCMLLLAGSSMALQAKKQKSADLRSLALSMTDQSWQECARLQSCHEHRGEGGKQRKGGGRMAEPAFPASSGDEQRRRDEAFVQKCRKADYSKPGCLGTCWEKERQHRMSEGPRLGIQNRRNCSYHTRTELIVQYVRVPALPVKNLTGSGPVHPALAGMTGILMCAAGLPVCLTRAPKPILYPPPINKSDIKPVPGVNGTCRKTKKKHLKKEVRCRTSQVQSGLRKNPEDVVKRYMEKVKVVPDEDCTICMERLTTSSGYEGVLSHKGIKSDLVGKLSKCGHIYHLLCLVAMYNNGNKDGSLQCPTCKAIYGEKTGTQPPGKMEFHVIPHCLPGYPEFKTIRIIYDIPAGIQGTEHPNPGKKFSARGFPRHCYLPDVEKGRKVLKLLIVAWDRRLIFTIGTSNTTGETDTVVWNEIHHKTEFGSNLTGHGYPDPKYLGNVLAELSAQGVTDEVLKD
ncbi:DTX1 ligase, partial [Polyodon spathula]|nr:DTX1 ligase [Polyodon spathula]